MASGQYTPKMRSFASNGVVLGRQPFDRDNIGLAFGVYAKRSSRVKVLDGQDLAGTGALVFEGEVLELPNFH